MAKQRTNAFMFRIGDENDIEGAMKITELKSFIKAFNANARKTYGTTARTLRVCLKGRKPKKKFAYKQFDWTTDELKTTYRGFSSFGDVLGGRDNWGACDVYVQTRESEYRPWNGSWNVTSKSNAAMCNDVKLMLHKMYNWQ